MFVLLWYSPDSDTLHAEDAGDAANNDEGEESKSKDAELSLEEELKLEPRLEHVELAVELSLTERRLLLCCIARCSSLRLR